MLGFYLPTLVVSVNTQEELWAILSFHSSVTKILWPTETKQGPAARIEGRMKGCGFKAVWRLQTLSGTAGNWNGINPLFGSSQKPPAVLHQQRAKWLRFVREPKSTHLTQNHPHGQMRKASFYCHRDIQRALWPSNYISQSGRNMEGDRGSFRSNITMNQVCMACTIKSPAHSLWIYLILSCVFISCVHIFWV